MLECSSNNFDTTGTFLFKKMKQIILMLIFWTLMLFALSSARLYYWETMTLVAIIEYYKLQLFAVPLTDISKFWMSLEMPLINRSSKVDLIPSQIET